MTLATEPILDAPRVDLRDPAFRDDPHPVYRRLHEAGPIHLDTQGIRLVTGHAAARALMQDASFSRDPRRWAGYATLRPFVAESVLERSVERWMLFNDAPAHTRLRRLFGSAFTPVAVRALRDSVRATAQRLVDALPEDEPFDLMRDFAQPFPVQVVSDLLGLPPGDFDQAKAWSDALAMVVEPAATRERLLATNAAAAGLLGYLAEHLERRRREPRDDLLGRLLATPGDETTDEELLANLMLMFVAGHETTTNLLGNGLLALLRHPDAFARLRADVALLPSAVEEMLRWDPPANMVARVALRPCEVAGAPIRAGEMLYAMVGAANHDPAAFEQPERFDIARARNPHLSFGGGAHYCIGAPLARLEAEVGLGVLFARFPRLALSDEPLRWRPLVNLRGLAALPLVGAQRGASSVWRRNITVA